MKGAVKYLSLFVVGFIIVIGIQYAIPPKTLDFRGTVSEIINEDDITVFKISLPSEISYTVVADKKTKVSHCHKDDPAIGLEDIKLGDTIEGDYRLFTNGKIAKFITVWCTN